MLGQLTPRVDKMQKRPAWGLPGTEESVLGHHRAVGRPPQETSLWRNSYINLAARRALAFAKVLLQHFHFFEGVIAVGKVSALS